MELLSDQPLFFLINSYTGGLTSEVLNNLFKLHILPNYAGVIDTDEIGLNITEKGLVLPCGISGRFIFDE